MADPSTSLHLLEVCRQACLSFVLLQMREQRDKLLRLGAVDDLVFLDLGPKFGVVHLDTHGNGAMRLAGCGGFLLRNELCFRNFKKKKNSIWTASTYDFGVLLEPARSTTGTRGSEIGASSV